MKTAWNSLFIRLLLIPINETPIFKFRNIRGGIIIFIIVSALSTLTYLLAGRCVIVLCSIIPSHVLRISVMVAVNVLFMMTILKIESTLEVFVRGWNNFIFVLWCIVAMIASYYINIGFS